MSLSPVSPKFVGTRTQRFWVIIVLGFLSAVNPLSVDMYLPAFQEIARALHTTTTSLSFTVSSYFIGIAVGQMVYGPLLDRFGRKKPLYLGLILYILASLGCVFSHSLESLIVWRFFSAAGGCVATVVSMAMVTDLFEAEESAKVFSLLMLVLGVSPLLAPTIGSSVAVNIGWQGVFVILGFLVLLMICLAACILPEGHPGDSSVELAPKPIIRDYWAVLTHPQFLTYGFIAAASFASLLSFIPASPVLFFTFFHVSVYQYGILFTLLAAGYISGSQISLFLLNYFKSLQILRYAITLQIIICLLFIGVASLGWGNLPLVFGLLFTMLLSVGCASPNAAGLALAPFEKNAGRASALFNTVQILFGTIGSMAIGILEMKSMTPIAFVFGVPALLAGGLFYLKKYITPVVYEREGSSSLVMH